MILIKTQRIKDWLVNIGKNQSWLANELGVGKAYVSQILANRCKISRPIINKLLVLSHIDFEGLFFHNDEEDKREFFGIDIYFRGKMIKYKQYSEEITEILGENGNHRILKKILDKKNIV